MKKLILISLIFLGLTSCSKKDDMVEPTTIQKEWYEGHYTGQFVGGTVLVEYRRNDMCMTIDVNPDSLLLVDTVMYSEELFYSDNDSAIFLTADYSYNVLLDRNYMMNIRQIDGSPMFFTQLTRID